MSFPVESLQEPLMWYDINFGTISWIDPQYLPPSGALLAVNTIVDSWVVKVVMGLAGTANYTPPPRDLRDVADYRRTKAYRALTSATVHFEVDPKTKTLLNVRTGSTVLDPGWTPPMSLSKFPSGVIERWPWDDTYYAGELSPLSGVSVGRRHPNGTLAALAVPGQQTVAHSLIKFRAGTHTDGIGVGQMVGAPFHVPWVWSELLLTYADGAGRLNLYGVGSVFPSHAWYLAGQRRFTAVQVGDKEFPGRWTPTYGYDMRAPPITYFRLQPELMNLYKVLTKGPSAHGPQTPPESELKQPANTAVTRHMYTVEAGKEQYAAVNVNSLAGLPDLQR
jgi:hypothetical protein